MTTAPQRAASNVPEAIQIPGAEDRHAVRRESFLLLLCAAFAGTVFLLWSLVRSSLLEGYSPEARRPIEDLKGLLGPFLTAYVAARLYSATVRRYERQLQRQRLLLAHILDTSADGIITLDAEDRISTWNRGAEQIFGYLAHEALGRHISLLYPPETDTPRVLASLRERLDRDGVLPTRFGERITRDGRRIRTEVSTTALRDARGRYAGRASIFRDVTERDRDRQELARRESLAAIGEMAAAVAHEIKNPLAGIGGAVKVIGRAFPEGDSRHEVVTEVQNQVRRLDDAIRDLLTFARPTVPRYAVFPLREVVARIVRVLAEEPHIRNHNVEIDCPETLRIRADPQLLENILVNLMLNAGQALGTRRGRIVVRGAEDADFTRLSVEDDGPGIPEEVLSSLFKPFFTTRARGTGLGLTIVRKFVETMGGRIEVRTRPGEGTAFTLLLPRPAREASP